MQGLFPSPSLRGRGRDVTPPPLWHSFGRPQRRIGNASLTLPLYPLSLSLLYLSISYIPQTVFEERLSPGEGGQRVRESDAIALGEYRREEKYVACTI